MERGDQPNTTARAKQARHQLWPQALWGSKSSVEEVTRARSVPKGPGETQGMGVLFYKTT